MIIFPYFSQLQSVYYANLRNQPFLLARAPRRWDVSQRETSPTSFETSQAARIGAKKAVFAGCICPKEPIKNLTSMSS